jgi:hypothetical protein
MIDVFYKYFVAHCSMSGVHFTCATFRKLDPLPPPDPGSGGDPLTWEYYKERVQGSELVAGRPRGIPI